MSRVRCRIRGRLPGLVLAAAVALALPLAATADRVEAVAPKAMAVGRPATLEVRLVDGDGEPLAAPRDLRVELVGAEQLTEPSSFLLPAGRNGVAIELRPQKAGAWAVEVVVEGFPSAWVPCTVFRPATVPRQEATAVRALGVERPRIETPLRPSAGGDAEAEPAPRSTEPLLSQMPMAGRPERPLPTARSVERRPVLPRPGSIARPGETGQPVDPQPRPPQAAPPEPPATPPPTPPPAAGRGVRLVPADAEVVPGPDGRFTLPINVYWYENGVPALRQERLRVSLVADPRPGDLRFEPEQVEIPPADFLAVALLTAGREGRIRVKALYPGGESAPAELFLGPAEPAALHFAGGDGEPERLRALAAADLPVLIRLHDHLGRPVPAPTEIAVDLVLRSEAGTDTERVTFPAGAASLQHVFQVGRFGRYRLSASAGRLQGDEREVEVAFDVALLLWALLGGLAGAALRLLWQPRARRGRTVARILVLGVAAAGIVLLLAAFGVLSGLEKLDPAGLWSLLETLPVSSQASVFLLGLLAGLTADGLFRLLTRRRRGGPAAGPA
ncbi:MAG TPA: hypothetical protein VHQ65_06740 [Thermoanaerobaculia bacterium]|nr:hypothetical protein [Thermoanaerobaculia bacterium]